MTVHRLAVTRPLPAAVSPLPAAVLVLDTTTDLSLAGGFPPGFMQDVLGLPEL